MHAVVTGERGEAEIGDDEPLGRDAAPGFGRDIRGTGDHGVGAGLQRADGLAHGEGGRDLVVELGRDLEHALVDLGAGAIPQRVEVVALELTVEIAVAQRIGEAAVADAIDLDVDLVGVDG